MESVFFEQVKACLQEEKNVILSGLSGTAKAFFIDRLFRMKAGNLLCLLPGEEKAYDLAANLSAFVDSKRIMVFPARDFAFTPDNYTSAEIQRMQVIENLILHPNRGIIILSTPAAFLFQIASPDTMQAKTLTLAEQEEYDFKNILRHLVATGYKRVDTINRPGHFAVRGGVLDIFGAGQKNPFRVEFYGDFIESIRCFDVDTQRSLKNKKQVHIIPANEFCAEHPDSTLLDYVNPSASLYIDEMQNCLAQYKKDLKRYIDAVKEDKKQGKNTNEMNVVEPEQILQYIDTRTGVFHSFFPGNTPGVPAGMLEHVSQREMDIYIHDYEKLFRHLKEWEEKGYYIEIAEKSNHARQKLQEDIQEHRVKEVAITDRNIESGFISSTMGTALITGKDIWGKRTRKSTVRPKRAEARILLENLNNGDYVVHESYGIGIFRGVTQVETDGITREYILLQYAGTDRLYLPLEKLDKLYMYHASEEKLPRLSKLGGNDWEKTRARVTRSIQDMAEKLLVLYASRQAKTGHAFSPDTPWQREFEDKFPYQETPDQLKAIRDVKKDMETRRSMDRLICGDVGYGKTEVAMRAAFKAVMDSKQVAVLVPTTVLAEQHFHSFQARFREYPVAIEVISRFKTASEQKKIMTDLKKGAIDIIIGTHRLLSRDIQFYDLGLLVIDEEHRFGVAQKEKIKIYKEMVDVISLSATPIPRSLHMSLTGLRDLTVIETPPPERYPVKTYVLEYNEEIIREAVHAEIERGGQLFFVHNRIEDIYAVRERLQTSLPDVSIAMGHGRMKEEELSSQMSAFLKGEYQMFLCTTIIESGLDMPNVNTIIIDEADKMGLAQLYQLRGRVGRSHRIAYAYLTYRPDKIVNEMAQKRLNAIREFDDLGAGMKIALRDLEIRGAGNILGAEQHGFIQAVGFDMYCRLLEKETSRLKGHSVQEKPETKVEIDADYYIPDNYINDPGTKIRIYRRFLLAVSTKEIEDIKDEIIDRFGPLPGPVENFIKLSTLRILAGDKEIQSLSRKGNKLELKVKSAAALSLSEKNLPEIKRSSIRGNTLTLAFEKNITLDKLEEILQMF